MSPETSETNRASLPLHLLAMGLIAFFVAALSIIDMYVPRPYDGVVLEPEGRLVASEVIRGSGADLAGIRSGDEIAGIARWQLRSRWHAAGILNDLEIGQTVPYLVRQEGSLREIDVTLGRRTIGDPFYLYACILGFSFFFIGLWVAISQPHLPASRRFFVLCLLFLLFLVCRLRPASYSWVDLFVVNTGTAALIFLPPAFVHFFMMFPSPVWETRRGRLAKLLRLQPIRALLLSIVWIVPPAVWAITLAINPRQARLFGSPEANWWVLAASILLGLLALAVNARTLPPSRQRQGAVIVFFTALVGLLPFVIVGIGFSSVFSNERLVFVGVLPLILFPVGFAYGIVRFQLLDVRVILRKSLLYTATTAIVTIVYAIAIASMNAIFRDTVVSDSPYFPIVFALAIVLLFEPLRRRLQIPVDRFFFAQRSRLQKALLDMGSGMSALRDPGSLARDLVERLPRILELDYAALYLVRGAKLDRVAGPDSLPESLPHLPELHEFLRRQDSILRLDQSLILAVAHPELADLFSTLDRCGVEVLGDLSSARTPVGLIMLSARREGGLPVESDELDLLRGLLAQAAIALETSRLLEDRARQAELERELEIAAAIQSSLLPSSVRLGEGWTVAAVCRPARQVGGDFFSELPAPLAENRAVIYGDVSGKSVSGALMMMAAKEALHTLATTNPDPEQLFLHANSRLYELGKRSFVALGYFVPKGQPGALQYVIAGQPQPLRITRDGVVHELPLDEHRLPLGAMNRGYRHMPREIQLEQGDVIFAYSDGVTEAQSPEGDFFGIQRLMDALVNTDGNPERIISNVVAALDCFTAGQPLYDDVTLMAIARSGGTDA